MEIYHAHIENDVVTSVEVVTTEFIEANPQRYTGQWVKVGDNSDRDFCGKGAIYLSEKDKIIPQKPYTSWVLSDKDEWEAPVKKPDGDVVWDEKDLKWILEEKEL